MLSAKDFFLQMPNGFEDNGEYANDNRELLKTVHFIGCLLLFD